MANIEHVQTINVPVEHVYTALTTQNGLSETWTDDLHIDNRIGGTHTFRFGDDDESKMRVEQLIPNQKIAWTCIESDEEEWVETTITFHLTEENGTTTITFCHANWRDVTTCYRFCNYNWAMFLYSLKKYCEEGSGMPYQKRTF